MILSVTIIHYITLFRPHWHQPQPRTINSEQIREMAVGLYLLDICQDSYFHRKYYVSFFGPGKKMKIFLCSANFVLTPHNYPDWQSQRKRRLLVLKSLCDGIFTENVTSNFSLYLKNYCTITKYFNAFSSKLTNNKQGLIFFWTYTI